MSFLMAVLRPSRDGELETTAMLSALLVGIVIIEDFKADPHE